MKFTLAFLISSLLIPSAISQSIEIGLPIAGTCVVAGSNITVEVDRPDTLTGSTEVAIAIGMQSCHNTTCIPSSDVFGYVLYNGPYFPRFQPGAPPSKPPFQNFTVQVPLSIAKGPAQLGVFHVSLVGAGPTTFSEVKNITVIVE